MPLAKLLFVALSFSIMSLPVMSSVILVKTKFAGKKTTIYSLEKPILISKKVDTQNVLNSVIIFELRGVLEGNFCGLEEPSLQLNYDGDQSTYLDDVYDVKMMAFKKNSSPINFSELGCPMYSKQTPFITRVKIFPAKWGPRNYLTWTYKFSNQYGVNKVLKVRFSQASGWDWAFKNI